MYGRYVFLAVACSLTLNARAQVAEAVLPEVTVYSPRVANQSPAASFAMPVSALRFEPRVDLQSRNFSEGQADVTIRGGIFENTGFSIGAVSLFDPQTGHYFAEIPVAPPMLGAPEIHVTTRPGSALPCASRATADNCCVPPTTSDGACGVMEMLATGTGVTETSDVPDSPSLSAVIRAAPVPTPVTSPDAETVAMLGWSLLQFTARPPRVLPSTSASLAVSCTL